MAENPLTQAKTPARRGRKPKATLVGANPGADKEPGARRAGGRPFQSKAQIVAQVSGLIAALNLPIQLASPDDALAPAECTALASALVNDPWTAAYCKTAGNAVHAPLVMALAMIIYPRLANHGIVPEIDLARFAAAVPMEAGGASGGDREDGHGEDAFSFRTPERPTFGDLPGDEAGRLQQVPS